MAKYRYRGLPGYTFALDGRAFRPVVGDVYDLDDATAASLGGDFDPVDAPTHPGGELDVAKATKAQLLAFAGDHDITIDPAAPVADIRAAVSAALDTKGA